MCQLTHRLLALMASHPHSPHSHCRSQILIKKRFSGMRLRSGWWWWRWLDLYIYIYQIYHRYMRIIEENIIIDYYHLLLKLCKTTNLEYDYVLLLVNSLLLMLVLLLFVALFLCLTSLFDICHCCHYYYYYFYYYYYYYYYYPFIYSQLIIQSCLLLRMLSIIITIITIATTMFIIVILIVILIIVVYELVSLLSLTAACVCVCVYLHGSSSSPRPFVAECRPVTVTAHYLRSMLRTSVGQCLGIKSIRHVSLINSAFGCFWLDFLGYPSTSYFASS